MRFPAFLAVLYASLTLPLSSYASTLDFEGVGKPNATYPATPLGFDTGGFHFSSNIAVMDVQDGSTGSNFGPAFSGRYLALNDYSVGDVVLTRSDGGRFNFEGVALQNSIYSPLGYVVIAGYCNGKLQRDIAVMTDGSSLWSKVDTEMLGVDTVKISRLTGGLIFFDDVKVTAVPEPATYLMLFSGLLLVGALRRFKSSY